MARRTSQPARRGRPSGSDVLWLSNETADPGGQGGQRRQYFQIRELVRAGFSVAVITPESVQDDRALRELATVLRVRMGLRGAFTRPLSWLRFHRAVRSPRWRAVIVAHTESWPLVRRAVTRSHLRAPLLVDLHNVHSRLPVGAVHAAGRHEQLLSFEREIAARADAVSACSAAELECVPAQPGRLRILLPHGIDSDEWPVTARLPGPPALGAIGSWFWPPNASGLRWFLDQVWPGLRDLHPELELQVAGYGLDPDLASRDGVRYLGRVEDRLDVIRRVDALIVAVRESAGAAVKFAEALASGLPVVATGPAASAHPGSPAFVSDDAAEWIRHLDSLIPAAAPYDRSPSAARSYALENLTWETTAAPLVEWVERAGVRRAADVSD